MSAKTEEVPMTFERFESRSIIDATLKMHTALSVGSRSSLEPTGTDLPVMKDPRGIPFIPGSSIKGVIRSQLERVLRSLDTRTTLLWACDPLSNPCVSNTDKTNLVKELKDVPDENREKDFSQKIWDKSCTVCRLFGSPWLASRIAFRDARLAESTELLRITEIRDGVGIDRDRGAAKEGLKYDFEVVSPDAQFVISIIAENVEHWEIGLLLAILRPWQEGYMPIGGKSTRGPGWGKLEDLSIKRVEKQDLLNYLLKGDMNSVSSDQFAKSLEAKLSQGA
jgi:CRISPR-associated RAMP protein (TIGR02581 family)